MTFLVPAKNGIRVINWYDYPIEFYNNLDHFANHTGRSWHYASTWHGHIPKSCLHYKKWYWSQLRSTIRKTQIDDVSDFYKAYGTVEVGRQVWIQPLSSNSIYDTQSGIVTGIDRVSYDATVYIKLDK